MQTPNMQTPICELVKGQQLVTLSPHDTVFDALSKFCEKNIISAPILEDHNKVLGFVDVLDLLHFMIKTNTKMLSSVQVGDSWSLATDDMKMMNKRAKDFKIQQLGELIGISKRNPLKTMEGSRPMSDAIPIFKTGIHRIAVMDQSGKLCGILTQGRLIRKLVDAGWNPQKKVLDAKFKTDQIVSVKSDVRAVDAFMKMFEENVTSLAVLEGDRMVGTLSASDLKTLVKFDFPRLLLPVKEFIAEIRKEQGKKADFIVHALPDAKLKESIVSAMENHVHRLFIVDPQMKPLAVMSLTDIIKEITC